MRTPTPSSTPFIGASFHRRRGDLWRTRWAAIGAAVAITFGAGGLLSVRAASDPSVFVAITPQRVLDTRFDIGLTGAFVGGEARALDVTGTVPIVLPGNVAGSAVAVPDGATALVGNVTAVRPTSTGFVAVRPGTATGAPTTSNVNVTSPGGLYPNSVTVELPTSGPNAGRLDLFYFADTPGGTTHLLFDIVGYYVEGSGTVGPAGPVGPVGPVGPAGPVGAPGPAGADGVRIGPAVVSTVTADGNVGRDASITIGSNGNPIISYLDASQSDLEVAACADRTCSSATITTLDSTGTVGQYSSIAVGTNGNPVISYYSRRTDVVATRDLKFVACTNPTCTGFEPPVFLDTGGNVGEFTSLVIGDDGNPVISYYDEDAADVKVVACTSPNCSTANPPITLVGDGEAIPGSIAIGVDGNPIITYWERLGDTSMVVACTTPTCTATNAPVTLGSGSAGSIVIGADGHPIISFATGPPLAVSLKTVWCTNPTCSSFNPPVTLGSGFDLSIAVGANGNPVILHYDAATGAAKFTACENVRCTSGVTATLEGTSTPSFDASMTIGADGNPIVAYYDATPQDLKVWACGNALCNPFIKAGR